MNPDFNAIAGAIGATFEPSERPEISGGIIRINPFWWCHVRHSNPKGYGNPSHVVAWSPREKTGQERHHANISDGRPALAIGKEIMRRVLKPCREPMRAWHEEQRADEIRAQGFRLLVSRLGDALGLELKPRPYDHKIWSGPVTFERIPGESKWVDEFRFTLEIKSEAAAIMIMQIAGMDWKMSKGKGDE